SRREHRGREEMGMARSNWRYTFLRLLTKVCLVFAAFAVLADFGAFLSLVQHDEMPLEESRRSFTEIITQLDLYSQFAPIAKFSAVIKILIAVAARDDLRQAESTRALQDE
ncbi:MAG: hypothetical protein AAF747_05945, partial [Planctomycetota bacterium]